jgi:hypothetical protein
MSKNMEAFFHYLSKNSIFSHFLPTASKTDRERCWESPPTNNGRSLLRPRTLPSERRTYPKKPSQKQSPRPLAKRPTPRRPFLGQRLLKILLQISDEKRWQISDGGGATW